jgi:hypothetical protein
MSSLKQVIVNAIVKISQEQPETAWKSFEDARSDFIRQLLAELFPENAAVPPSTYIARSAEVPEVVLPVVPVSTGTLVAEEPKVEKKKPAAKKPAAKKPKVEEKPKVADMEVDAITEQVKVLVIEPVPEKKKPGPKPKKEKAPTNVDASPTFNKKFKAICDELKVEANKKATIDALNKLTPEEFNAAGKKLEDHLRDILRPKPVVTDASRQEAHEEAMKELEGTVVDFEGKEYVVDADNAVYQQVDGAYKRVGYVGLAAFKSMVVPEDE